MNKKLIRIIITFVVVLIFGLGYVAIVGDNLSIFEFKENSNVIHAILYSAAAICAVLVMKK